MRKDLRYQSLKPSEFPEAEALKHCLDRVQIYWDNQIVKDLQGVETLSSPPMATAYELL
jgi:bisphosphoglycerate-dependent phosphoglycerate mutase